jgi:hypothetical protein
MYRVETLREQARILRTLAKFFDSPPLRGDVLVLAKRSDELAEEIVREIADDRKPTMDG